MKLLNLSEVAKILSISKREVYRLIANGDLPKPLKVGRSSKMLLSDIEQFIERLKSQRA